MKQMREQNECKKEGSAHKIYALAAAVRGAHHSRVVIQFKFHQFQFQFQFQLHCVFMLFGWRANRFCFLKKWFISYNFFLSPSLSLLTQTK